MPDNLNTSSSKKRTSHIRTTSRRNGIRLTREETIQAKEKFLKSFATTGNVRAACMAAGIDRTTVYNWSEHDQQFSMQYNLAKEDVNDAIRGEIYRRAMIGEEKIVTSMGKVVYHDDKPLTVREKSDTLLMFHAKSRMSEYRDKQQIEHSGPDGGPIQVQHLHNLTEEELDTLEMLAKQAKERSTNGR